MADRPRIVAGHGLEQRGTPAGDDFQRWKSAPSWFPALLSGFGPTYAFAERRAARGVAGFEAPAAPVTGEATEIRGLTGLSGKVARVYPHPGGYHFEFRRLEAAIPPCYLPSSATATMTWAYPVRVGGSTTFGDPCDFAGGEDLGGPPPVSYYSVYQDNCPWDVPYPVSLSYDAPNDRLVGDVVVWTWTLDYHDREPPIVLPGRTRIVLELKCLSDVLNYRYVAYYEAYYTPTFGENAGVPGWYTAGFVGPSDWVPLPVVGSGSHSTVDPPPVSGGLLTAFAVTESRVAVSVDF